jgi:glyoxylase-like metal-dependent hydrolase (beta-lactamase superfamily II)
MKRREFLYGLSLVSRPLPAGVEFLEGAVNGIRIGRGARQIAIYGDPRPDSPPAERVLLTHHRRDAVWPARALMDRGAVAVVPAGEQNLFAGAEEFWRAFQTARYHDYAQQSSRVLTRSLTPVRTVAPGDRIELDGASIEVAATPGYTRGAVSYLIEAGGNRLAATGDLIYGDGRLLDVYSLQDAIPEAKVRGYHGYAARAAALIASLRRIAAWRPGVLLPARGPAISDPQAAIGRLIERIQEVFRSYYRVDALRWYWGDGNLRTRARRVLGQEELKWLPMAGTVENRLPDWLAAISNTRAIVSRTGAVFLVDCGSRKIFDEVRSRFNRVEGLWITHYHDDHTDFAPPAAEAFRCPVYACAQMKEILEDPAAFRMPAQTSNAIRDVRATRHGETLRWREFEFTFYYFPGQTIYHGGLHIRRDTGEEIFFAGDSFTPTGLDDYCLLNRNFLRPGAGFLECLRLLAEKHPNAMLVNQHVEPLFRFSAAQLDLMREELEKRRKLFADLFPWPEPNYGLDEQWARFHPYELEAAAGRPFEARIRVLNHSPRSETFRVTVRAARRTQTLRLAPGQERSVAFSLTAPSGADPVAVVTADVAFAGWDLREWCEALVRVRP